MTKQQIVVQFAVAKLAQKGYLPGKSELEEYGSLADKIIEMFPEPDYSITTEGISYEFDDYTMSSIKGENLA